MVARLDRGGTVSTATAARQTQACCQGAWIRDHCFIP